MSEFDIIRRYFSRPAPSALLGVGDDCALLAPRAGMALAVSTDMLVEGRHFAAGADPQALGHKSLAVNLSDLAAMGALPRWALLALSLPQADEAWLAAFSDGLYRLAERHGVALVGGDTTRGPLAISITVIGEVPPQLALRRDRARAGDDIWVSGATGMAAMALEHLSGRAPLSGANREACLARLHTPQPRVELGLRLRAIAAGAIDVSDGLLADLAHVLESSGVGAEIWDESIPRHAALASCEDKDLVRRCVVAGGDDYELLFTARASERARVEALAAELGLALTRIGVVLAGEPTATLRDARGNALDIAVRGYDHFR
ncbi:MAG: thiamine-phosphate kinase [Betaproteobacteria bacterium]|nr:thiamine-phosphate kinase [Betaproteobacteria bacterium]